MEAKYVLDTKENKEFMQHMSLELLKFGKNFPSDKGSSYYLGDDGTPIKERPRETWITCRMVHVYSIGCLMGHKECEPLVDEALRGIMGELCDKVNGGWYPGIRADGTYIEGKQCYAHAFVILAATSALLAKRPGADKLLCEALEVYNKYFWDEKESMAYDTWNTEFTRLDDYRGINANMHTVEAFLAVADATGQEEYRQRAGRIIGHVIEWALENDYHIPEHFTKEWEPDLEYNSEHKEDPFKPYGATPGHAIEWARLICQWTKSTYDVIDARYDANIGIAENLFNYAIEEAWNVDGNPGIVYTTDWNGVPVVHDRMHWTLAEAINTSAVLYRITGKDKYSELYSQFMKYLDEIVIDHKNGSWFHQLDETNRLAASVWPGKSDLYHAFQSTLIPYNRVDLSIAQAINYVNQKPCNKNASPKATELFEYLKKNAGKSIITGQHTQTIPMEEAAYIKEITGKQPKLRGFELLAYSPNINYDDASKECLTEVFENRDTVETAINWAKENDGIVTLSFHWFSPVGGRDKSFYTEHTDFDARKILEENTPERKAFYSDMDVIADILKKFADANIPVLWRPFHEADGTWFWWGAYGPVVASKLYCMMYDYYTNVHKLNNLLWVWNCPVKEAYPGDDYVDVVSMDIYMEKYQKTDYFEQYRRLVTNTSACKVTALAEVGYMPDVQLLQISGTPWAYYMTWSKEFCIGEKYNSVGNLKSMYDSDYSIKLI